MAEKTEVPISYIGLGIDRETDGAFALELKESINSISISCEDFSMKIFVPDLVDLEELMQVFSGEAKKAQALCHMERGGKLYKGRKKFINKGSGIFVSQAAIRIRFSPQAVALVQDMLKVIKEAYSRP